MQERRNEPQDQREPGAMPGQPEQAAEARAQRRAEPRRTGKKPIVITGLILAGAVAGGVIFHDDLGRFKDNIVSGSSSLGKDASKEATPRSASESPSPKPSRETPTPKPTAKTEDNESNTTAASKDKSGNWIMKDADGKEQSIAEVKGFTPDKSLTLAPEWSKTLSLDPKGFADFQKSLNNSNNPLVGYSYGENDQSDNLDYRRTLQGPLQSWTVMTGENVSVPGVGELKGEPGMAVEVMVMNISNKVIDWGPKNPVMIKHGFTGTGRIWDGDKLIQAEQGVSSHYANRLEQGVTLPGESGFIGQCDLPENCNRILVVSVVYRQWGNNQDGTPRYQFQLLREEIVKK